MARDIEQVLGSVPEWLTSFPDQMQEHLWMTVKGFQLGETTMPNKYKELIGLAVAAQMQCPYCIYFHT
jgi:alkylhydroperoxidase/carboxymuconolactone decarboxylase family protein YurZ